MNRFFHYKERGGSLKGEVLSGLTMFFLAACGIFVNMQLIAKLRISGEYASAAAKEVAINGEIYAQAWFLSMLIAFVGSLLLGLIAGLPMVQVGGLGLSTVLLSMFGLGTGLSYYNFLFVCFVSSVVYTAIIAVPAVRNLLYKALPGPVRQALPAAAGLLLAWICMQLTGLVTVSDSSITIYGAGVNLENASDSVRLFGIIPFSSYTYGTDMYHPLMKVTAIAVIVTFVLYLVFRQRVKRPFLFTLLLGTVVFFVLYFLNVILSLKTMKLSVDSLWGRLWMVGSEDAMQLHLNTVLKSIKFGRIFSSGSDFTAYKEAGGNVGVLFATTILNFIFVNMYQAEAVTDVVTDQIEGMDQNAQKAGHRVLLANGIANIAAPLYGAVPVSISPASAAGAKDGGKTGLSSIVASIGFLVSAFVWVVPFLFATGTSYTISFNMYGHYGTVFQLMSETAFAVADAVMVLVGLSMAAKAFMGNRIGMKEAAPFAATVIGTLCLSNLAGGVAAGVLAYAVTVLTAKREEGEGKNPFKRLSVLQYLAVCAAVVVLVLLAR